MRPDQSQNEGDLVRLAAAGDERAYSELVARYMRPAYMVALSVTRRHEDAEDAAQGAGPPVRRRLGGIRIDSGGGL